MTDINYTLGLWENKWSEAVDQFTVILRANLVSLQVDANMTEDAARANLLVELDSYIVLNQWVHSELATNPEILESAIRTKADELGLLFRRPSPMWLQTLGQQQASTGVLSAMDSLED